MTALFLNFYFTKVFVNGLESALQYACICATIGWASDKDDAEALGGARKGRLVVLALLCAATTLARLSAGVFALATLARVALSPRRGRSRSARSLALTFAVYACPVAAYLAANDRDFGHWLPVSAAIKGSYWGLHVPPLIFAVAASTGLVRIFRRVAPEALPLAVYACAQSAFDAGVRGVLIPEIWYLVPHATLLLIAIAKARPAPRAWVWGAAASLVAVTAWSWRVRLQPHSYSAYTSARNVGQWLDHNIDRRAIVAGWDCGIVGAYSQRRMVNLDGLANSWQFKERYLDTGRVQAFVDDEGSIDYIAQPVSLDALEADASTFVDHGVDLSRWHLAHVECTTFHSVVSRSNDVIAHLVLSRAPLGPEMKSVVGPNALRVCARSALEER